MHSTPLLPLPDYQRISSTVYSVLAAEKGDIHKACLFFAIAGAVILGRNYKEDRAHIVTGAALYRLGAASNNVLALATPTAAGITSTLDGFHCWIETDNGWLVDFQAPLFPEMTNQAGWAEPCPRMMFQRRLAEQATSPAQLRKAGDFLHVPNDELTASLLQDFQRKPAYIDLIEVMASWYRTPPKEMRPSIQVANARGEVKEVPLRRLELVGAW